MEASCFSRMFLVHESIPWIHMYMEIRNHVYFWFAQVWASSDWVIPFGCKLENSRFWILWRHQQGFPRSPDPCLFDLPTKETISVPEQSAKSMRHERVNTRHSPWRNFCDDLSQTNQNQTKLAKIPFSFVLPLSLCVFNDIFDEKLTHPAEISPYRVFVPCLRLPSRRIFFSNYIIIGFLCFQKLITTMRVWSWDLPNTCKFLFGKFSAATSRVVHRHTLTPPREKHKHACVHTQTIILWIQICFFEGLLPVQNVYLFYQAHNLNLGAAPTIPPTSGKQSFFPCITANGQGTVGCPR